MRCTHCKRPIAAGVEAQKMIVEYRQGDATTRIFGHLMSDGPLSAATGQLLRGWHHKCFHIVRKREAKGDAVTGRVLGGGILPTGYDIAALVDDGDTRVITDRLDEMRAVAQRVGKPVGDPAVTEAFRAEQHGGPYRHTHDLPMETYQLLHHLHHAHGINWVEADARGLHAELHARAALEQVTAGRDADPGHTPTEESDWREQVVTDLDQLT